MCEMPNWLIWLSLAGNLTSFNKIGDKSRWHVNICGHCNYFQFPHKNKLVSGSITLGNRKREETKHVRWWEHKDNRDDDFKRPSWLSQFSAYNVWLHVWLFYYFAHEPCSLSPGITIKLVKYALRSFTSDCSVGLYISYATRILLIISNVKRSMEVIEWEKRSNLPEIDQKDHHVNNQGTLT